MRHLAHSLGEAMTSRLVGSVLLLVLSTPQLAGQTQRGVELTEIDLGERVVGVNAFRANLTNHNDRNNFV